MDRQTVLKTEKVVNKTIEMYIDEEGILRIAFREGAEIDIEEAKENLKSVRKISGDTRMLNLIDARAYFTMTKKAREFAAGKESNELNLACAVVNNSLANRLLINFFVCFNKPKSPLRMFSSEQEALIWLRKFRE